MPAKDFEKLLTEAIDEGLSSLGETMRQTVYSRLEEEFGVPKTEIPYKVATFAQAVEAVLGVNANDLAPLISSPKLLIDPFQNRGLKIIRVYA